MNEIQQDEILFAVLPGKGGDIGLITLNRPQALNALNHTMCLVIEDKLKLWAEQSDIKAVVVQGAGDKAFCAGGDIRNLYEAGKRQQYDQAMQFFEDEYRLNYLISHYPKPYIAFMDGITMGGGMGLSIHGAVRIGTERLSMAMPETGIGFFPDIGGTYFLSRCPDEMGIYLGLTGARIDVADALYIKLIDHVVPSHRLPQLLIALQESDFNCADTVSVNAIVNAFHVPLEPSTLFHYRDMIEACFSQDTVEAIIAGLAEHQGEWHQNILANLCKKSPLSLKVTLSALRRGLTQNLQACLSMEYNLCYSFLRGHDFYEGVRALLIDKDKNPHWQPATLEQVTPEQVEQYFTAA